MRVVVQQIPVITLDIANRIERSVAEFYGGDFYNRCKNIEVENFGNSIAVKIPSKPWRSGIFCFSDQDVKYLKDIVEFFRVDYPNFNFYLSPMGYTKTVGQLLIEAGLIPTSNSQTIFYGVPSDTLDTLNQDVIVEPASLKTIDSYIETQITGFEYRSDWRDAIKAEITEWFSADGFNPYLVLYRGEPAGSAYLMARGGIGYFADDAVVPKFRGKGLHLALLNYRLSAANNLDSELVISGADFGSTSFRNHLRVGFRQAYIETTWQKVTNERMKTSR